MARSPIEQLIELQGPVSPDEADLSDHRRAVLRLVTDNFMIAPDRYGHREMELFDLLLSRTARAMDQSVRRLIAMTLVRAGARDEHVKIILTQAPSPTAQFLRRSVVQTRQDLLVSLQERIGPTDVPGDPALSDGNSLTLPSHFSAWLYFYIARTYLTAMEPKVGQDRTALVERTIFRGLPTITETAGETARDDIITARRTVRDWVRRQTLSDDLLAELLEARAMTEFVFALSAVFDMDVSTTIRILNDNTFESLAIAAKANDIRRSVFAKMLTGFGQRHNSEGHADRILGLYDRVSVESAERAIRFWRLRVADLGGTRANLGNDGEDIETGSVAATA